MRNLLLLWLAYAPAHAEQPPRLTNADLRQPAAVMVRAMGPVAVSTTQLRGVGPVRRT